MVLPSWTIHEKWGLKIGIPLEVLREVNKIIDLTEHNIGRRLKIKRIKTLNIIIDAKRGLDIMMNYLRNSKLCSSFLIIA